MRRTLVAIGLIPCCAGWLVGDVVNLKNGDRLTGTVVSLELKSLKISTAMAGDVSVPLDNVQTFQTDGLLALVQEDGSVVRMRVVKYENGQFILASAASAVPAVPAARATPAGTATSAPATAAATSVAAAAPSSQPGASATASAAASVQAGLRTIPANQIIRIGPAETKWKGNVIAGGIITRGNSTSEAFNAGFELNRRGDYDRILIQGDYAYGREKNQDTGDTTTSTDRWTNTDKYDYFLSPKWYAYAGTRFEHDGVADLYLRATPGAGLGYQWIETDRTKFSTETGMSWVYERYSHPSDSRDFFAARLAWHLSHKVGSNVELIHNFEILPNVSDVTDYVAVTDAGVRLRVTGHLFTEAKAIFNYDSTPADDKHKLDQQFRLNLGYDF